jgi:hypothetical protein
MATHYCIGCKRCGKCPLCGNCSCAKDDLIAGFGQAFGFYPPLSYIESVESEWLKSDVAVLKSLIEELRECIRKLKKGEMFCPECEDRTLGDWQCQRCGKKKNSSN